MLSLKKIRTVPVYVGASAFATAAFFTLPSYWHCGTGPSDLYFALAFPAVFGLFCGLMQYRRLLAWLAGLVLGFAAGAVSALPLLSCGEYEGEFFVSSATLAFFVVLGLILGAAGEFVRLLHYVAHGGNVLKYPESFPAQEPPFPPRPRP